MYDNNAVILVGIDVGSTTTKIAAVTGKEYKMIYSDYQRHHSSQLESVRAALKKFQESIPCKNIRLIFTGSGAKILSEQLGMPYIQEVVANAQVLKAKYKKVGTAIELGGQDAKIIFFRSEEKTGQLQVKDMRMNGSCAGGTGAFLDEAASILGIQVEQMEMMARRGRTVYDISGRCGVYAKTDMQPLLNQGVEKPDLAYSVLHAIAKQTIGGLAQGLTIEKPVVFEGGPMTFIPTLVSVFAQRLNLKKEDIIIPKQPEIMVALGAALSLGTMFKESRAVNLEHFFHSLDNITARRSQKTEEDYGKPFFASHKERESFEAAHRCAQIKRLELSAGQKVSAYLGIDCGSTTTKFVLMNEDENLLDTFYASNEGDPLAVMKRSLIATRERYKKAGAELEILAACTTGYGEMLMYKAFSSDCHIVETVAHAQAANKYVKDASFVLDIGGQDMKAIWLRNGVITNILVNEACSSGCGSFLENFAATLHIPTNEIADKAFASKHPAVLGSRCTVFMNSSIVTAQRNGKQSEDIMAGLCRSIIENVFSKVIRISNLDSLGDKIVVQGGTFCNAAVLCAMEQYVGRQVVRAPYPGMMGAIGAALFAKAWKKESKKESSFIRLEDLEQFSYEQKADVLCPFCGNHCRRVIMNFSNGNAWVTNNKCERGEIIGDLNDRKTKDKLKETAGRMSKAANLFKEREKLLFKTYPYERVAKDRKLRIGIPRVLFFWDTLPFWRTFFEALGFEVLLSDYSTRKMYESGLCAVASDTVCFPAKLVHGHLRNLADKRVERIFMPMVTTRPSENTEQSSESMCAVVKGYPLVIQNSDNPKTQWGITFDAPMFHWHTKKDRRSQLCKYMRQSFEIPKEQTLKAIRQADKAQSMFHTALQKRGQEVIDEVSRQGKYAVVLASRPYQNDPLVHHNLPQMFTGMGIPVLTADSVPGIEAVDLSKSRLDIVNNYHARMLSTAILAAENEHLEYVQLVSFGCGHDAYLSDEIIRLMQEISAKTPLILKVDESDNHGPLQIRVRSFIETINIRKKEKIKRQPCALMDPYLEKFEKADCKEKIVLVPNTSHAFSRIMAAALARQGLKAIPLEIGRKEAISLGKKYVHNDICFPAQIVIGEALAALESGKYDVNNVAIAMGKYIGDCRLTHYTALLRKALDDAGYQKVSILTNDDVDYHNLHPGFRMNLASASGLAFALPMIDVLEELLRKIRPYEKVKGSTDIAFEKALDQLVSGLKTQGVLGAQRGFKKAIKIMKKVKYDRSKKRPQILIVGEYLLNFHPGANHDIEKYLEANGFEIIEARMTDVIRKSYYCRDTQNREFKLDKEFKEKTWYYIENNIFELAHDMTDRIAKSHPLYERASRLPELAKKSDSLIYHTFDAGEGILIPGEIIHHAERGCRNFVILQPFGCLPNHVVGRGIAKKLKELYPDAQILPLDYDPDVSFANLENRLQMLVMNRKNNESAK